jgi:peptide/nickel transport system substrate-binding protein
MRRNSVFFEILKIFLLAGVFGLLILVYWSSSSVEEQVIAVKRKIDQLEVRSSVQVQSSPSSNASQLGLSDPSLPNLLITDPFDENILPELLGKNFKRYPTLLSATIARPASLHPFAGWADVIDWIGRCSGSVATNLFGKFETLSPSFAWKMEERQRADKKGTEFWIHLRRDLVWEPLRPEQLPKAITLAPHFFESHPVTANDFKFYFDLAMNPFNQEMSALALQGKYDDIEALEVMDPYTFVVRWKSKPMVNSSGETVYKSRYGANLFTGALVPLADWVYAYSPDGTRVVPFEDTRSSSTLIQHLELHWAKNIIPSCGPWVFEEMSNESIRFQRNKNYFDPLAALYDESEVSFRASFDSVWNDFKLGKLSSYLLSAQQLPEWERFKASSAYQEQKEKGQEIESLSYLDRTFAFIGWNNKRPIFASKKVRQALTLAIDRPRIIQEILYGQGIEITGTFPMNSSATDPNLKPWPFDPDQAKRILKEEGWADLNRTGVLEKEINGVSVPFAFKLVYFGKAPVTRAMVDAVSTQLAKIGVRCEPLGVEMADLSERMDNKNFDAITLLWGLGTPPEDPRQIWSSKGANEIGSSNFIGFMNEEIDQIIDKLDYEDAHDERVRLYHRFCQIIYDEQPYTFLYTVKQNLLYRNYIGNVFLPIDRQDLVPGANVDVPVPAIFFDRRAF